jgi:hypothetical protein
MMICIEIGGGIQFLTVESGKPVMLIENEGSPV